MSRSLLLICGKLPEHSALELHLGLKDIFALRFGANEYRASIAGVVKSVSDDFESLWISDLEPSALKVQNLVALLSNRFPQWRAMRNIVIWPAWLHFNDRTEFANILRKLALTDGPVALDTVPAVSMCPVGILESPLLQDRWLGQIEGQVQLQAQSAVLDLSDMQDLFKFSRVGTSARMFNQFETKGAYLTKRSTHVDKLRQEYGLLSSLPSAVRAYFPAVGEARDLTDRFEYEVEFVPVFDVCRMFIHGALDQKAFSRLLSRVDEYLAACPKHTVSADKYEIAMNQLFVGKLCQRFQELQKNPEGLRVIEFVNSAFPQGLEAFVKDLAARLEKAIAGLKGTELAFSHGDLCFSNMLFDAHSGYLKLIDPRGAAGDSPSLVRMPVLYDVAKLAHSALGGYDLICNGMAEIKIDTKLGMTLGFGQVSVDLDRLKEPMSKWIHQHGWDISFVRLCQASLFISMMPLHLDRPAHVAMQALAGLKSFREAVGE